MFQKWFKKFEKYKKENNICQYCKSSFKGNICGKSIRTNEWKKTAGYKEIWSKKDHLDLFILKGKNNKKAGLMIENENGARYIDIDYCPFCGRRLDK